VDSFRRGYVRMLQDPVAEVCAALGLAGIRIEYRPGWEAGDSMATALREHFTRDAANHVTSVGPHRADLKLSWNGRAAKTQVSRGQQKLLAAGLVLAQTRLLATLNGDQVVLLVDDPAAELDKRSLSRLMEQVRDLPGQLIVTAIDPDLPGLPAAGSVFHVERGVVTA
jgi:DNA replication and repair protein RecF